MKFKIIVDPDFRFEAQDIDDAYAVLEDYFNALQGGAEGLRLPASPRLRVEPVEPELERQEDDG